MSVLSLLAGLAVKALTENPERGARSSSVIAKLALCIAGVLAISKNILGAIIVEAIVGLLGALGIGLGWLMACSALALIPSTWLAVSSVLMGYIGLGPQVTILDSLEILVRSHALSLLIAYTAISISIIELHCMLIRLRLRGLASLPLLVYRLIVHGLNSFREALDVAKLKRPRIHASLAAATASLLEESIGVVEANSWRISLLEKYCLPRRISIKWLALEVFAAIILTAYITS